MFARWLSDPFFALPLYYWESNPWGLYCPGSGVIWSPSGLSHWKALEGEWKTDRWVKPAVSSPLCASDSISDGSCVSSRLQILLEGPFEFSASAGWCRPQGSSINASILCLYSSGISYNGWVPDASFSPVCLYIFSWVINFLHYSPSV